MDNEFWDCIKSIYTISQQLQCSDSLSISYSSYMFRRDFAVGILKVLLTTTTGCIDSLTYIIQPYAH
jgi:hypothetical protein